MWKISGFILLTLVVCFASSHPRNGPSKSKQRPPQRKPQKHECSGSFLCGTTGYGKDRKEECLKQSCVCDGIVDCFNGIDEEGCAPRCSLKGEILCKGHHTCGKPCNGIQECPAGDDERNCPAECFCGDDHFLCVSDGTCIHTKHRCDGQKDCRDGEDEEDCRVCCQAGEYRCNDNATCVLNTKLCDGETDCPNNDDEASCPSQCQCQPGQYFCDRLPGMDQVCVDAAQTCETNRFNPPQDCPLGDDELALGDWCSL